MKQNQNLEALMAELQSARKERDLKDTRVSDLKLEISKLAFSGSLSSRAATAAIDSVKCW